MGHPGGHGGGGILLTGGGIGGAPQHPVCIQGSGHGDAGGGEAMNGAHCGAH